MSFGKLFITLFDGCGFGRDEALEKGEELGGLEAFEHVIGLGALVGAGCADDDDGKLRVDALELGDKVAAGHVMDAGVEDDSVEAREGLQGVDRLVCAVGGDDVKLGGLDDELARRDAARVLTVDDEETRPHHAVIIDFCARFGKFQ